MKNESIIALVLGILGATLFTALLALGLINELGYIFLLLALAIICLVLHGFSRLQELDLKNLKMTLSRIEQVREDIYAKEEDLRKASVTLSELIAFTAAFGRYWGSEKSIKYTSLLTLQKTRKLLDELNVSAEDKAKVFRYPNALERMEQVGSEGGNSTATFDEVADMMQAEYEENLSGSG